MAKVLCILSLIVAVVFLLIFTLDALPFLAEGFIFRKANLTMDIGFAVASAILAYLSWSAFREQK